MIQEELQQKQVRTDEIETSLKAMKDQIHQIKQRSTEFYPDLEKSLLEQYLKLKGNIRVFLRVRPILAQDYKAYDGSKDSFAHLEQ